MARLTSTKSKAERYRLKVLFEERDPAFAFSIKDDNTSVSLSFYEDYPEAPDARDYRLELNQADLMRLKAFLNKHSF